MVTLKNKKMKKSGVKKSNRSTNRMMLESLETRQLFSLLGVLPGLPITSVGGGDGSLTYSASTHSFDAVGIPSDILFSLNPFNDVAVGSPSSFDLHIKVGANGTVSSGNQTNDLTLTGSVDVNGDGVPDYSGVLLTGKVLQFGYASNGGTSDFDFRFQVTGGQLAAQYFSGKDIGVALSPENSTFTGNFNNDFTALEKGTLGAIPPQAGTPPIVISGHKYLDQTGNGLSADDTSHPLGGVTIQLYKDTKGNGVLDSSDALVGTTVTAADGSYSFTGLTAATYFVKEVQQTGYVETGPTSGLYTVKATAGVYGGLDFDNFKTDKCSAYNIHYVINGCKNVNDISGQLHQGDTVKVIFTIKEADTLSFVSYTAPDNYFNANDASQQKIYSVATGTYTVPGTYCLTITVPQCNFQVDFVCGLPIDKFGPAGSNIFYHSQDRYFDSDNGGCNPCSDTNSSISGTVSSNKYGYSGISGVKITLTGVTAAGNVTLTAITDSNGNYKFSHLAAGTYAVSEKGPDGYADGLDYAGSLGGTVTNNMISNIVLSANTYATDYNFGELALISCNNGHDHSHDHDHDHCDDN